MPFFHLKPLCNSLIDCIILNYKDRIVLNSNSQPPPNYSMMMQSSDSSSNFFLCFKVCSCIISEKTLWLLCKYYSHLEGSGTPVSLGESLSMQKKCIFTIPGDTSCSARRLIVPVSNSVSKNRTFSNLSHTLNDKRILATLAPAMVNVKEENKNS